MPTIACSALKGAQNAGKRPAGYHRKRHSIEAHLTIVFAALAVSHWIETTTRWSIEKFVRTARRYRTITIQTGPHTDVATGEPIALPLKSLSSAGAASRTAPRQE